MTFDVNIIILLVNFLLYLYIFINSFRKYRRVTPYGFTILWVAFVAFMGVVTYMNGLYQEEFMPDLSYLPIINPLGLILVFLSLSILLSPLKILDSIKIENIIIPKLFKYFELFVISFFVVFTILLIPYCIQALVMDAVELYTDIRQYNDQLLPKYMMLLSTLGSLLFYFFLPYCFYQIRNKITFKYIFLLLLLLVFVLEKGVIGASRGALFLSLGTYIFAYLLFYKDYSRKVKKITIRFLSIFIVLFTILGTIITISRFSDMKNTSPVDSVIRYFGESFNNFSFRVWGDESINHTNGEAHFPGIYSLITGKDKAILYSKQEEVDYIYVKSNTAVMNNFSTIYGQLYVEFGWFLPLIFISVISFLIYKYFKKKTLRVYQFPILIFLFQNLYFYSPLANMFRDSTFRPLLYVIILAIFVNKLFKISKNDKILNRDTSI